MTDLMGPKARYSSSMTLAVAFSLSDFSFLQLNRDLKLWDSITGRRGSVLTRRTCGLHLAHYRAQEAQFLLVT